MTVPQDMLVSQVIQDMALEMEREHKYVFSWLPSMYELYETLPLKLLKIHDCALVQVTSVVPLHLKCSPVDLSWTVLDLLVVAAKPLKVKQDSTLHNCVAERFFKGLEEDQPSVATVTEVECFCTTHTSTENGCTETLPDATDNHLPNVEIPTALASPVQPPQTLCCTLPPYPARQVCFQRPLLLCQENPPNYVSFTSPSNALPPILWEHLWTLLYDEDSFSFEMEDFSAQVYEAVGFLTGNTEELLLCSTSVQDLADKLIEAIEDKLLAPLRTVQVVCQDGSIVTLGPGLEVEALFLVMSKYVAQEALWFERLAADYCSLKTITTESTIAHVPTERLKKLKVLGALTLLMVLNKLRPGPLSLTWYPEIHNDLQRWKDMSPSGNPSPFQKYFSSYMQSQAASYENHTIESHNFIVYNILLAWMCLLPYNLVLERLCMEWKEAQTL
ncbi:uncharacterized protein FOMMEDRAFT_30895 [Fomitiporia mediterranea MF3/22]|uniref:uncharacterized protein n=1 Tax=Fomitiporia mediterranea (strain MF3/22) TaxID=694068 RepID=UPI0004409729|nr:uncharacterized protein FOMMEDRAFT_30895 [Fomitiporia mediterranea MF3/22]EJD00271.1 hypothetical protein FOMMEDRAFT_30895 [Fomitiporia mediterranea MF3/22]